jgi:hypothetical protein
LQLDTIEKSIAAEAPTTANPFHEVLLEGYRPFVNRADLRARLQALTAAQGSTLLLITGQPQTGKSFSFYLAQHIARQHGYITSQFEVAKTPQPDELASEILDRIGVALELRPKGNESAERWAEKLAGQVKDALETRATPRLLVFDGFPVPPQPPLPAETASFIVRLAKYSDEELRASLRVLLVQFTATLPPTLDDVAERDEAVPFTNDDMLGALKQIRLARGWSVSDQALETEIKALQSTAALRDRFHLLRKMITKLATPPAPPQPPVPNGSGQ